MRQLSTSSLALTALLFFGCQFNQSAQTDFDTGASSSGVGISVEDIRIEVNGKTAKSTNFTYGDKIDIVFNMVNGLNELEGRTFPEMSLDIVKNDTDTIISHPRLLKHLQNGTDLKPILLTAFFNVAISPKGDNNYKALVKIRDRKGDGSFNYELPFTVKPSDLLKISSNDLDYSTIYLWDDTSKRVVNDQKVNVDNTYILILEGIDGLEEVNAKVYPIFALDLRDAGDNIILSEPNIFAAYVQTGVAPELVKEQISATITFTNGNALNPCKLNAIIKDKHSNRHINITTELKLQ